MLAVVVEQVLRFGHATDILSIARLPESSQVCATCHLLHFITSSECVDIIRESKVHTIHEDGTMPKANLSILCRCPPVFSNLLDLHLILVNDPEQQEAQEFPFGQKVKLMATEVILRRAMQAVIPMSILFLAIY